MREEAILVEIEGATDMDEADDDHVMEALRGRLQYATARLNHDQRVRDTLAGELAETERLTGSAPAELLRALDHADHTLLADEADILDAELALVNAADRRKEAIREGEGEV